jgi:acylphosphatase
MLASEFLVSGRVQGVGFRASTQMEAKRLGLAGFANNLADGRVRVRALGVPLAMAQFQNWLEHGPPFAKVEKVQARELTSSEVAKLPAKFSIGSEPN